MHCGHLELCLAHKCYNQRVESLKWNHAYIYTHQGEKYLVRLTWAEIEKHSSGRELRKVQMPRAVSQIVHTGEEVGSPSLLLWKWAD